MAQKNNSDKNPENGKKLWLRIVILLIAFLMLLSVIILPFIS